MRESDQISRRGEYGLLLLLTLLAAALRFYKLGEWSIFIDEFRTWDRTINLTLDRFFRPNSAVTFWLLTKLALTAFGESAISLRLVPCIVGILTIPLVYFPIRKLFDKHVALASVLMIAVSPWHIYMSQMARWYTLLLLVSFLALISFYAFIERGEKRYFFFYIVLSYIAITLHLTGFFLPIIAAVYLVCLLISHHWWNPVPNVRRVSTTLFAHVVLCLAFIPMFVTFIQQWKYLEELVGSWGGGLSDISLKVLYHTTPSLVFGSILGLFFLLTLKDRRGLFLALYCFVPFTILGLFAVFGANVSARYQLFTLPAVAMAAGFTITHVRSLLTKNNTLVVLSMIIILMLPSLQTDYLYFTSEYGYRHRSREVFQYIKERIAKDDQLFLAGIYPTYEQTFYAKSFIRLEHIEITDERLNTSSSPETLDLRRRTWVITRGRAPENPVGFRKWVAENTRLVAEFPTRRGAQDQTLKVHLYSPPAVSEPARSETVSARGRG